MIANLFGSATPLVRRGLFLFIGVFGSVLSVTSGCSTGGMRSMKAMNAPAVEDSTLTTGDLFDVRVYNESDLTGSYKIEGDGAIDFPLAGRLQVNGKTPREIAHIISEALAKYLQNPQVSVLAKEINSKRITFYGQVQHPGSFPYQSSMTISQGISLAGGFTGMALREKVRISHREGEKQTITEVNVQAISDGRAPNVYIAPGDEIYVPERSF